MCARHFDIATGACSSLYTEDARFPTIRAAIHTRLGLTRKINIPAWIGFAAKAVIGGVLLWFVITRIPFHDALSVASTIPVPAMVAIVALYFLAHAVNAAKLHVFLPHLSLWQSFRFTKTRVV